MVRNHWIHLLPTYREIIVGKQNMIKNEFYIDYGLSINLDISLDSENRFGLSLQFGKDV